jgi:uncharacterized protein
MQTLIYAANNGLYNAVKAHVDAGSDVNEMSRALPFAAERGHIEIVQLLLSAGALPESVHCLYDMKALHSAIGSGHTEIVQLILSAGADVNACRVDGMPALVLAAYNGYLQIVKDLLRAGATLESRDSDERTALHAAATNGHLRVVQFLVGARAFLDVVDSTGRTPLHSAARKGYHEIVKFIVNNAASLDIKTFYGETALHMAAKRGHKEVVQVLVSVGAAINEQDRDGCTALHNSLVQAISGHADVISILVHAGADLDIITSGDLGQTALHMAVSLNIPTVVEILVRSGAQFNIRNKKGMTPLDLCTLLSLYWNSVDVVSKIRDVLTCPGIIRDNVLARVDRFSRSDLDNGDDCDDGGGLYPSLLARVLGGVSSRSSLAECRLVSRTWRLYADASLAARDYAFFEITVAE